MNEFTGKKLGEVLAFSQVGNETLAKGRDALVVELGEAVVRDLEEKNRIHADEILKLATVGSVLEVTTVKAEKTSEKLRSMRELYVGDQWSNATELFEWSGFFEGAAIVHWTLIRGIAEALENETLQLLAEEAITTHHEFLEKCATELESVGQNRAV